MTLKPRYLPLVLFVLAAVQLLLGLWMAASPQSFYDSIATYGPYNDHYIRDFSSFYIALGLALIISTKAASWRVPVLFIATVQYFLHTLSHILDVNEADPVWVGIFNLVLVAFLTVVFAALLRFTRSLEKGKRAGSGTADDGDIESQPSTSDS